MQTPRPWIGHALRLVTLGLWAVITQRAGAADVILNEYNAVNSPRYLDGDNYTGVGGIAIDKEDSYFETVPGLNGDGRVQGNGGNWFELVVAGDHIDMRGWKLQWAETNKFENDGSAIWYTPTTGQAPDQGVITLSSSPVWSDLRAGTIVTFSRRAGFQVDTTPVGGNKNFNDFASPLDSDGTYEASVDLSTNMNFNPNANDWWLHVSTRGESEASSPLATTVTNTIDGLGIADPPGSFSTGNDAWQLNIVNASGATIFGPTGEDQWSENVNSRQVGKLEADPSTSISPSDTRYNQGTSSSFGQPNVWTAVSTVTQNFAALRSWYKPGDFDEDGDADGADLLAWQRGVGAAGAKHSQGDANFDGAVTAADLAIWRSAFAAASPTGAPVPEPTGLVLAAVGAAGLAWTTNRRWGIRAKFIRSDFLATAAA